MKDATTCIAGCVVVVLAASIDTTLGFPAQTTGIDRQLTFVLMTMRKEQLRFPLQLASLARFATPGTLCQLIVTVPDADVVSYTDSLIKGRDDLWTSVREHASTSTDLAEVNEYIFMWTHWNSSFAVSVVKDSQVLPSNDVLCDYLPRAEERDVGGRGCGYRKQMLLKIGIAWHVKTRFYVTLDTDVIATRSFGVEDFIMPDAFGGLDSARIQGETEEGDSHHEGRWWTAAANILDGHRCMPDPDTPTIGVTPAVIPTRTSLWVMERVKTLWSAKLGTSHWDLLFFKLLAKSQPDIELSFGWTEYTSCFLAACLMGEPELFANTPSPLYVWCEGLDDECNIHFGEESEAPLAVIQGIRTDSAAVNSRLMESVISYI